MEEYPSGWRGRFAKSLGWRNLAREFESPLLRQTYRHRMRGVFFVNVLEDVLFATANWHLLSY